MALDDYFSCKYNLYPEIDVEEIESSVANSIQEEKANESKDIKKYTRDDLLSIEAQLTVVKPNFTHLDQAIQEAIVLKVNNTSR